MKLHFSILCLLIFSLVLSGCASSDADYSPNEIAPAESGASSTNHYAITSEEDASMEMDAEGGSGESYLTIDENTARPTSEASLITFSLKVDTAAYSNVARFLEGGSLPPKDAVRTEELINYFSYDEPLEFGDSPFAIYTEVGPSPFDPDKHIAFIRVATEAIDKSELPSSNLTFLIDTSGSMNSHDKLPLLKQSFALLVETLDEDDVVSIVTYAGSSGVLLDSVSGADKETILNAINNLNAGGSTAGSAGIVTAYELAEKNFMDGGNNRIILASDGDFNVGISNLDDLTDLISEKRDSGVYLSVLGFGTGNIRDDIMETLAANGNGNYHYINNLRTGNKVLVDELASNLFTVADDVKAQVEFNPANVSSYRLIGYENRMLSNRDFNDDTKDAGEVGAGTDVVVLFEIDLNGNSQSLKYQESSEPTPDPTAFGDELFEVRIRYKNPGENESNLLIRPVQVSDISTTNTSDFRFACSVAAFSHLLRNSDYKGDITIQQVVDMAEGSLGRDIKGYRLEHLDLLQRYRAVA